MEKNKKGRGKAGEKAGEIQDFWTKFFMSTTLKIRYNFGRKWGKGGTKFFLFQLLVKGLEPMLDKELEGKRMERGRDKDFYV
ncbi:hypothetical protein ABW02_19670 [Niallia circulans]|uniref:Uncharacterized protein n=1 Tax=Niallia circulans TaxID=1397 RepID=A0A0J1IBB2_NIACI|nr:hypothetical protein [Niallia circulans]KLV23243.1 hypothetical protein ABW02_19670 [Niallia circulans]MED5100933.1 hypothetical protein [Niallia circulans]